MEKQQLNKELLSNPAVKLLIQNITSGESLNVAFDTKFDIEIEDEYKEKTIKSLNDKIKYYDIKINNGNTEIEVKEALRTRKIHLSRLLNYMVTHQIADLEILKRLGITKKEMLKRYWERYHTAEFIRDVISEHPFIEKELNRLAEMGEPYYSKNAREMEKTTLEIEKWSDKPYQMFRLWKLEKTNERLNDYDIPGGTIENLCHVIKYGNWKYKFDEPREFCSFNYFRFSPTAHDNLIELIVRLYKAEHRTEIAEYRKEKNRAKKNSKRNTKTTTATEKRVIVQNLKKQGLVFSQAYKEVNFSVALFKRYWK